MKPFFRFLTVLLASCLLAQGMAFAQTNVRGRVTDSAGQPLAGVTVMIQGTSVGTSTDADGNWSLQVPKGSVLEFASLGMTTVTRPWKGEPRIDISMGEDILYLEDVVVVGYGTAKKETLTAAVSAIKGDELLKSPSTNVSQVLAGKLSGLSSVQESGEPGLDQASLRIRGSVYGVSYVVDGFPVSDINDIDPADIESISVLKDGASAAVYGLKAAGGVIIVTTKKGNKGDVHITYNGSVGVSMNANFPEFMDGPQYAYYYNVAQMMDQMANGTISSASEYVPYFTQENVAAMTNGDPTDGWDNVNYIKKVFGTGVNNKHNLTLQGGNDKIRYFIGAGYLGQKGNIEGYNYSRFNLRANVESKVGKYLTVTAGLSGVLGNRRTPRFLSGGSDGTGSSSEVGYFSIAHQTIGMLPFLPEKMGDYYTGAVANNQSTPYSPLAALSLSGNNLTKSLSAQANMSIAWDIPWVKGLQVKVSGAYDNSNSYNKNLATPYYVVTHDRAADGSWSWSSPKVDVNGTADGNVLGEGSWYAESLTGQAGISYTGSFGKHNVDALVLAEIRDYKTNNLSGYVKNLPFALLPELSNGTPTSRPVIGSSDASRSAGYVGRVRYNYDEKYLAEFTGRLDGSYKFAGMTRTRWGFFPSVSLGWRASKEEFLSDVSFLDDLKLRASAGLLGSDNVSAFMFLSQYAKGGKVVHTAADAAPSYYTTGIPNKDLSWDKTLS